MKFTYEGEEYDLAELVGKNNLKRAEKGDGMIITKDGMTLLLQRFPQIDCTFGDLQVFTLKGAESLALQACAFNRDNNKLPIGRSWGELSTRNADEFAMAYPVSTVENRGRNRAVLKHMGITGVFSEEELKEYEATPKPAPPAVPSDPEAEKKNLIKQIKGLTNSMGWDDAKRVRLYCVALEIPKDTPAAQIKDKLTVDVLKKALAKAQEIKNKG